MSYTVILKAEARLDLKELLDYYDHHSDSAGDKLLDNYFNCIDLLEYNPFIGFMREKEFREFLIKKFPVLLIYKVIKDDIIIFRVFHVKREPTKKFIEK